jgi:hypothetical protein
MVFNDLAVRLFLVVLISTSKSVVAFSRLPLLAAVGLGLLTLLQPFFFTTTTFTLSRILDLYQSLFTSLHRRIHSLLLGLLGQHCRYIKSPGVDLVVLKHSPTDSQRFTVHTPAETS